MVSWAVTGATRGIGFGWINKLSADPKNQVYAIIRSRATAAPLEDLAVESKNIHIVETDLSDPKKLKHAAAEVSKATGGSLDILLLNHGAAAADTSSLPLTAFHGKEEELEHEISQNIKVNLTNSIYVTNAFLDLVHKGTEKKIIFVSSSSGDIEFTRITGLAAVLGYSIAKAGLNMVATKFSAESASEGIKKLDVSPGWVDTDAARAITGDPEIRIFFLNMFQKLDPTVTGPIPVAESVSTQLHLIQNSTEADSGKFSRIAGVMSSILVGMLNGSDFVEDWKNS